MSCVKPKGKRWIYACCITLRKKVHDGLLLFPYTSYVMLLIDRDLWLIFIVLSIDYD